MIAPSSGFLPLGPVQSQAVLGPLGLRSPASAGDGELDLLSAGIARGVDLALGRLRAEAQRRGAAGVVHVRADLGGWWTAGPAAPVFAASGTAVRRLGRPASGEPVFTATGTAQEWAAAVGAGWRPVAVVVGVCAYYASGGISAGTVQASARNREHPVWTEAVRFVRRVARERLRRAAERWGADGVVGTATDLGPVTDPLTGQALGGPGDWAGVCLAIGTAVRRVKTAPTPPSLVLPLGGH